MATKPSDTGQLSHYNYYYQTELNRPAEPLPPLPANRAIPPKPRAFCYEFCEFFAATATISGSLK